MKYDSYIIFLLREICNHQCYQIRDRKLMRNRQQLQFEGEKGSKMEQAEACYVIT